MDEDGQEELRRGIHEAMARAERTLMMDNGMTRAEARREILKMLNTPSKRSPRPYEDASPN